MEHKGKAGRLGLTESAEEKTEMGFENKLNTKKTCMKRRGTGISRWLQQAGKERTVLHFTKENLGWVLGNFLTGLEQVTSGAGF